MPLFLSTLNQMGVLGLYMAIGFIIAKLGVVEKSSTKVLSKLEKVKADKVSVSQLINNPAQLEAYGLPSAVDNDGRTIISYFVEKTINKEEVTYDDLMIAAKEIVLLNDEVQKQLRETETNRFYKQYYDYPFCDKDGPS